MACNCGDVTKSGLWTGIPSSGLTEMLPGEDPECYAQRATDDGDKAGGPDMVDKIFNSAIVPDCEMKIDMQFKLTDGSPSDKFIAPVHWKMVSPDTNEVVTISGLTFTSDGKLSGQMDPQAEGKTFNVKIIAIDSTLPDAKEIDSRSFNFSPKKCVVGGDLKFIHPLPGSIMTSGFGPRNQPTAGASTFHKGLDFAYPGRVTKDVLASCDGKVTKAGVGTGYGNVVYIQHVNGSGQAMAETRYGHLDKIYVSAGQQVSAGQPIGKEGNTGVGTGPHLHFEIRLPGDRPVDPLSYINGEIITAKAGSDPGQPGGSTTKTVNTNKAITTAKVNASNANCKTPLNTSAPLEPAPDKQAIASSRASCRPETTPTISEVKSRITAVMDKHLELDESDRNFIMQVAKLESGYDPYAKNKTSSATGLFQMIDSVAEAYYKKMGLEATCENRCDIEKATEAMINFYVNGSRKFYLEFKSRRTIAGKKLTPELIAKYDALTKEQFCYGLIHHDGVGNAVKGNDLQGVQLAKSKFSSTSTA